MHYSMVLWGVHKYIPASNTNEMNQMFELNMIVTR